MLREQARQIKMNTKGTMKRALGYFGMALAGGLLALGIHDRIAPQPTVLATSSTSASAPARFVNYTGAMPSGGGA